MFNLKLNAPWGEFLENSNSYKNQNRNLPLNLENGHKYLSEVGHRRFGG